MKINVDCRFWDGFKNLDCVKVLREYVFLWINFVVNMIEILNYGKMIFRYKLLNKLYGFRKKGDLGIFNNFKIIL